MSNHFTEVVKKINKVCSYLIKKISGNFPKSLIKMFNVQLINGQL